jgi:hypothetical protein
MISTGESSAVGRRYLPWALLAISVLVAAAIFLSRRAVLAAPEQPLPFSHQRHTSAGIQCTYCHPNAARSDFAGMPSVAKCIGCHQTIAVDEPAIQLLTGYWERQEPIPWQRVTAHSDFVYFSHQAHLVNSVSCEACHGPVGSMDQTQPIEDMDMGFCLDCHLDQPEEKVARLADCLACHK